MKRPLWARLWHRGKVEEEISEEMRFHVESAAEEMRRRDASLSVEESLRRARIEFGSVESHREEAREAYGYRPFDEIAADVRYALRSFRKRPVFAAVSVLVLATASGANSTFFSFYSSYVLKPLSIHGAERHYRLEGITGQGQTRRSWTQEEFDKLQQADAGSWEGFYGERTRQTMAIAPVQAQAFVSAVSLNYFSLLGGTAAIGRTWDASDGNDPVIVLSDSGWRRLLRGDPQAVGQTVQLRNTRFTVIGVAQPRFTGTEMVIPDGWVPMSHREAMIPEDGAGAPRFQVGGILRSGVSAAAAEAALSGTASALPASREEDRLQRARLHHVPSAGDNEEDAGVAAMFVAAAFVVLLLVACANLTSLQLARAASRSHEIGVRLSLGASRWRIVRQLLTESFVLSFCGAALGLAITAWGTVGLHGYFFSEVAKFGISVAPLAVDWRVVVYACGLAILAGLAFGLAPAIQITAPDLTASTRKEHSAFAGRMRQHRLRDLLLSGQVAASLVLLIVGGVLVRNIQRLGNADVGFDVDRVVDLRFHERATPRFLQTLRADPQLEAVSAPERPPLMGFMPRVTVSAEGQSGLAGFNRVDADYFAVLGLRALRGRLFSNRDAAAKARVVVLSESTAAKYWPAESPVGKMLQVAEDGGPERGGYEVIGTVPDLISGLLFMGKDPTMAYFPATVDAGAQAGSIIVRTRGAVQAGVRSALQKHCENHRPATLCQAFSMREAAEIQQFPFRAAAVTATALGGASLALTCIGLFGVVAFGVAQRTREIGIRMAVGATSGRVVRLLMREAMVRVGWGLAAGLPVCLALSQMSNASAARIQTFDPVTYALAPLLLLGVALVSGLAPAMRAARVDPTESLRQE